MTAKYIFVLLITAIPISPGLACAKPQPHDCTQACLIEIEGLQETYSPGSVVNVRIRNRSKHALDVNVAVEGLESGSWLEIIGSISDPQHALSKILILRPVKTSASLRLSFDPCKTPIIVKTGDSLGMADSACSKPSAGAAMPTLLRLRVDVHVRGQEGIKQRVRSREFGIQARN